MAEAGGVAKGWRGAGLNKKEQGLRGRDWNVRWGPELSQNGLKGSGQSGGLEKIGV